MVTIKIASDHAGFDLKTKAIQWLQELGHKAVDLGPATNDRVDYPDFADALCKGLTSEDVGLLICGSGQGMAMRSNKYPQIRAALCWNEEIANLARSHNDANVLCLGARVVSEDLNRKIIVTFLSTEFEGGRHETRSLKIGRPLEGE